MPSKRLSYKGFTRLGLVLMSAMAVSLASACTPVSSLSSSDGAAVPSPLSGQPNASGKAGSASAALAVLAVRGRAPKTGYDRAAFGQAWADVDRNGCDTRNDVLRRDLRPFVVKTGTKGCVILSGTLHDPYSGTTIDFVRGVSTSSAVQIDHVVPLSDAWQKGAQQWSTSRRTAFANDPLNLLAVDGLTNQRKSDGDAATWLPPDKAHRCPYAARQIAVKARYRLWVTGAERDALARILATCPSQTLPVLARADSGAGAGA